MKKESKELKHIMLLVLGSIIWGAAFVAQSVGAEHVGPLTFLSIRSWLGAFSLVPVIIIMRRRRALSGPDDGGASGQVRQPGEVANGTQGEAVNNGASFLGGLAEPVKGGFVCGTFLFAASLLQQAGIAYTTTAKAGFITALYVVFVPVLSLLIGLKSTWKTWVCMVMGVAGLYLLCMTGGSSFGRGDLLMLACAFTFSLQIMSVNHFVKRADGLLLAEFEFFFEAVLATFFMLIFEKVTYTGIIAAAPALLYTGLLSSGVGYTLQIIGQEGVNPSLASLVMSLESVFSAISGWLILGQSMSVREILGCLVMFAAIVLSQL